MLTIILALFAKYDQDFQPEGLLMLFLDHDENCWVVLFRGLEIINFTFIREIFESGASDFENRNASIA